MAKFSFIARDQSGKKVSGLEEASSQDEMINRLQARNLLVVSVSVFTGSATSGAAGMQIKSRLKAKHYKIKSEDLTLYCRQLATLLSSGITIVKSLNVIAMQVSSFRLASVIKRISKDMEQGLSFHEAMAKHPSVFSDLWVNLVESGEASGNLAMVLERLAKYLERNEAFKSKIISSLIYPIILFSAGTGALIFLTVKIIPTFAELFKGFNITLPYLTRILISVSEFVRKYVLLMMGSVGLGAFLLKGYIQTKEGRHTFEQILFLIPVFGEFFRALTIERFSSEMSTLIESGVPILYALEISERSVGNIVVARIINNIKESVRQGKPLSKPIEESGFFDPMVVQMLTIGEEIGELAQMFKRINVFYQEYVETFLVRFTSMFEPLILVFMGLVIGIMVVGMFLPIFQIAQVGGG